MNQASDMDNEAPRQERLTGSLAQAARALKASPPTPLPQDFAARVVQLAEARAATTPSTDRPNRPADRLMRWLAAGFRPRTRSVRPALQWAWVVALCAVTAVLSSRWRGDDAVVMVRFSMVAPAAHSVSVAGDFNGWAPAGIRLQDPLGDGRWQALVPMAPGVYQYMFVVDGKIWVADPQAAESMDDGFGQRNSLMRIADDFL
jgi:hypothetical protein